MMAMKYDETIVVRCSGRLKRVVNQWAKQNDAKPGEITRRVLEIAFGVEQEELQLPPGVKRLSPAQGAPVKS